MYPVTRTRDHARAFLHGLGSFAWAFMLLPQAAALGSPAASSGASASTQATVADAPRSPADRAALEAAFRAATTRTETAMAALRLAEHVLVEECAPMLSSELYESFAQRDDLSRQAAEGLAMLSKAEAALADLKGDSEMKRGLRERVIALQAFGRVFVSLGGLDDEAASREALLDACAELASYLDDLDPRMVESAKLWQGVAYRRAGRPERALQVLRPATTTPAERRIGFFARLQRCQALGDGGHYSVGLALCHKLNARVEEWFAREGVDVRRQAEDSIAWVRADLVRRWVQGVKEADGKAEAGALLNELEARLRSESRLTANANPLHLTHAVAGLPLIADSRPVPASQATSGKAP